mmetsp:Transcript_27800/g.43134  ORF Transcript_27800/g.43134 Transcript_27800/m.43134 type:complete len:1083 (+) Transcript_27800:48-3296(+)
MNNNTRSTALTYEVQNSSKCLLWSGEYWNRWLQSNQPSQQQQHQQDGDMLLMRIPHECLAPLIASLVHVLKQHLQINNNSEIVQSNKRPKVVCVGIAEGPYLPLAILALHALGLSTEGRAVLCPVEITMEYGVVHHSRNVHAAFNDRTATILEDVGCDLLLMRGSCPADDDAVAEMGRQLHNDAFACLDMDDLVGEALEVMYSIRNDDSNTLLLPREMVCIDDADAAERSSSSYCYISHIVYTSGTTGRPKGCVSSMEALRHYIRAKNEAHGINADSTVLLASNVSFDPCLSDIIATYCVGGCLALPCRSMMQSDVCGVLHRLRVTHVLCTPSLWRLMPPLPFLLENSLCPSLEVVALGGEKVSKRTFQQWARADSHSLGVRLLLTYGVTEACVYQTCGEVWKDGQNDEQSRTITETCRGQCVGIPLAGNHVRICKQDEDVPTGTTGEVVLHGKQVDELSMYWGQTDLTLQKFSSRFCESSNKMCYYYRTGDLGFLDSSGRLHIIGRVEGEDGMVKVNGVRIELGEIEAAILTDSHDCDGSASKTAIIEDCVVSVASVLNQDDDIEAGESLKLVAYCILSSQCWKDIGSRPSFENRACGYICPPSPLLTLLRHRCEKRSRKDCLPSTFVLIDRVPTSATGKTDRRQLPLVEQCQQLSFSSTGKPPKLLRDFGKSGEAVTHVIIKHLNLQPCQFAYITSDASFGMLGGDSLTSVRIARSLYALHHGIQESRHHGGTLGTLDGPFAAVHLVNAENLGQYVKWLDSNQVCQSFDVSVKNDITDPSPPLIKELGEKSPNGEHHSAAPAEENVVYNDLSDDDIKHPRWSKLSSALMEATMLSQTSVAIELLAMGADPNFGAHGGRLGKVSSRLQRRGEFTSAPIHLACSLGNPELVKELLRYGCKCNIPDASGIFPIHLACAGKGDMASNTSGKEESQVDNEHKRRLKCVKLLLDDGKMPIMIKDGNKQTILHCAARAGNVRLIEFIFSRCHENDIGKNTDRLGGFFNWTDHWFRSPVHWGILNGHVDALRMLLANGCMLTPPMPSSQKPNRRTSALLESPKELALRLYKDKPGDAAKEILLICQAC